MENKNLSEKQHNMSNIAPASPSDIERRWLDRIPSEIFSVINDILVEKWNGWGEKICIKQDEILDRLNSAKRGDVFKYHWLDIEPFYRSSGWTVGYNKPAYNESYDAYFIFTPPKKDDRQ